MKGEPPCMATWGYYLGKPTGPKPQF